MGGNVSSKRADLSPGAAIVIPVYNGQSCIEECLSAVLSTSEGAPIFLVENGSDDGSRDSIQSIAEKNRDRIRTIYHESNLGFPTACNAGIRMALDAGAK